jgi:hypothetical protein
MACYLEVNYVLGGLFIIIMNYLVVLIKILLIFCIGDTSTHNNLQLELNFIYKIGECHSHIARSPS